MPVQEDGCSLSGSEDAAGEKLVLMSRVCFLSQITVFVLMPSIFYPCPLKESNVTTYYDFNKFLVNIFKTFRGNKKDYYNIIVIVVEGPLQSISNQYRGHL